MRVTSDLKVFYRNVLEYNILIKLIHRNSNHILIFIEIIYWWEVAVLSVLGTNEDAEFWPACHLEVTLSLYFSIRISCRLVKLNTYPESWGKLWHLPNILYFTTTWSDDDLASLAYFNLISIFFLEIIWDLVSALLHEIRVLLLHICFELPESIISLTVFLFTYLVLFNLAHILKLSQHTRCTINHMNCVALLRTIMSKRLSVSRHCADMVLGVVPQFQTHCISASSKPSL